MHMLAANENIFFLVLVAIVGLIRWLWQANEARKNSESAKRVQPPPNTPIPRAETQTEEERVRRFMDALGVPTSNAPPPKMPRRPVTPKTPRPAQKKVYPVDPFPKPRVGPWAPQPVEVLSPTPVAPPPVPSASPPALQPIASPRSATVPVFEIHVIDGGAEEPRSSTSLVRQATAAVLPQSWAARFANSAALRDSIILREILGPPRSLQPLDSHSLG